MAESRPFVLSDAAVAALAACAALGAWLGTGGHSGPGIAVTVAILAVALAAAVALRRPALVCVGVALLAATFGGRAVDGLEPVRRGPVAGWATLVTDPAPLDNGGVRADVRIAGRRLEATAFGRAAVVLAPRLAGEQLALTGAARPPPDDAPWLVARRVVGRLTIEEITDWAPGSPAAHAANALRRTLERGAADLPVASRSLLTGVVLGDDRFQPPEVVDDFRAAGLSHLTAVSGSNVAFTLALAGPVLTRLRWSARLPLTVVVLAAFALLVRFEPSVLRAVTMAGIAALAAAVGRPAAGARVLGLAVAGLVLVDPLLVRSVGFGLSVCASAAIVLAGPWLRTALAAAAPSWLADALAVTIAAQVGTLPLLLATFGATPVAALPANLLAVPAAAPLMVWGLTGGLFAGFVAPAAGVLHLPTAGLTWWLAAVARWAAGLPLGEIRTGHAVALAVVGSGGLVLWRRGVGGAGWPGVMAVVAVLAIAAIGRPRLGPGPTPVGPAAVVWAAGGASILVVEGPGTAERTLEALRRAGTRCVDVVAVAGGGRAAAAVADALDRRCAGATVLAPAGRAHPGWRVLAPGRSLRVGGLVVAATPAGGLRVGSAGDVAARAVARAVARAPPRRGRRRRPPGPGGPSAGCGGGRRPAGRR